MILRKRLKIVLLGAAIWVPTLFGIEISVSSNGEISNLPAARDAVRELRVAGEQGDIDVVIHAGTYYLDQTLIFGLEDAAPSGSVTRYRAADGVQPLISGGRVISDWKQSDLADGNIWVADVPWAKGDAFFHCLYDAGTSLQRAQSETVKITNENPGRMYTGTTDIRVEFGFEGDVLRPWENLEDIELFGSPTRKWMVNYLPIASIDTKTKQGRLTIPATYRMSGPFVVENCIDHLDSPGEWVLDSHEGKLYYWPESGMPGRNIIAPVLNELIRVEGVNDSSATGANDQPVEGLVFEGLRFSHADRQQWLPEDKGLQHDWNMWDKANGLIRFRGAQNCIVRNCIFSDSGSDGVRLDLFCQNITVEDSFFRDLGGTGILLSGYGPGKKDVNKNNTIHNNEITRVGRLFLHSPGVFVWQSGYNKISHNHIYDQAYTGLVVSGVRRRFFEPIFQQMGKENPFTRWIFDKDTREHSRTIRWDEITLSDDIEDWSNYEPYMHARGNIIEFNEVHDCLKLLHDGNCIYLSGNGDGNVVRHNVTYNHPQGAMIRTDDDSHDVKVVGNLLFGTAGNQGITIKGLNTATGNVFVNCQLLTGGAGNTVDPDSDLSRNVFYHTKTEFDNGFHYGLPKVRGGLDYNLYFHEEAGKGEILLAAQREVSTTKLSDVHSVVADPMFIDHIHGDFGFKKDSLAIALGIEPLPLAIVEKIGTLQDPFLKRYAEGVPMHFKHTDKKAGKGKKKELNL